MSTPDEFRSRPTAGAGHADPPQQAMAGGLTKPTLQHERLAADWPTPQVQQRQEPRRFALPDWSKTTWVFAVGLTVMVIFAFIAVISDPTLAKTWVEAMFGKLGGLIGG